ncbi:hypothetical protein OPIT5_06090 [Opitutaceae bacterium TAV5]|nr:hypothetical protein OPIT5_06090 [Opitutaceae bacterium TAV5]
MAEVLLIISEGSLGEILRWGTSEKHEDQFHAILKRHGFWYSLENHYIIVLYQEDEQLQQEFLIMERWRWVQELASRRLYDIHAEVFEHFGQKPEDLKRLTWRQYEQFLDSIFRNQGFFTELGPGRNDGGIDIRLYQSATVPELVTIVQARRYTRKPIGLEAVAALFGHAVKERAKHAIFATTSRFLPGARKFAISMENEIDLPTIETAESGKVAEWCLDISKRLEKFYQTGADGPPLVPLSAPPPELVGKIVVHRGGVNMTTNDFAVVEADFPFEAILRPIGARQVTGDSQVGQEIPEITASARWTELARVTARKETSSCAGGIGFIAERKTFFLWDGQPLWFNYCD